MKYVLCDRKYMLQGHDFSNLATFSIEKEKFFFHMVFHGPVQSLGKKYVVKSISHMSSETGQVKVTLLLINRENKLSSNMVKGK